MTGSGQEPRQRCAARPRERGAALIAVLFVVLLCEIAILLVTTEINHLARRVVLDRDRVAAARLAESGLEHAYAFLALPGLPPQRFQAGLAEGRYEVSIQAGGDDRVRIESSGRTWSGRRVTIELLATWRHGVVTPGERSWRHQVGGDLARR